MPDSTSRKNQKTPSMARKASKSSSRKTDPRIITGQRGSAKQSDQSARSKREPTSGRKVTPKRAREANAPQIPSINLPSWSDLSAERKIDVYGTVFTLLGLVSLVSLLVGKNSGFTAFFANSLFVLTGWGALLLPIGLIAVGLWLIFRRIEKLPTVSGERFTGLVLLFLNFLTLIHILFGGGWELAAAGSGGGRLGGFFERLLVAGTGTLGGLTILAAWAIIGFTLVLDVSVQELFINIKRLITNRQDPYPDRPLMRPTWEAEQGPNQGDELPSNFKPLVPAGQGFINRAPAVRGGKNEIQPPAQTDNAGPIAVKEPTFINSTTPRVEKWTLPRVDDILDPPTPAAIRTNVDQERARIIEETLRALGAPGHVTEIQHGPTVTMFGVEPEFIETRAGKTRVRVGKIASLADDLTLALAAPRVRIQAPVPGRDYVGIEVPNTETSRVSLSEVMSTDSFKNIRSPLRFALGKNVAGKAVSADLVSMPHLLIAGTTGSGKSVCINSILSSFLLNNSPSDLRLILVDPKRVELNQYNGIPHLLSPVITDAEEVLGALQWMLREMDTRYHKFAEAGVRNIQEYNASHPDEHLQYLVIVIDELADLMMLAPDETERSVTRLAQLARATGIHLILATQRPSVDVVTGSIKANFPARISFAVASNIDSRVILDQPGAERLLGRGDLLFQAPDASSPVRLQGVYVSDNEIQRLVDNWKVEVIRQTTAPQPSDSDTGQELPRNIPLHQAPLWYDTKPADEDPFLAEAIDLVRREGRASITMLQRHLRIGYTRAARLIDAMEEKKIVAPSQANSQVREILDYGQGAPPPES